MKKIYISDYKPSMGILIDLEDASIYQEKHINGSINIPYKKLLYDKDNLLNKNTAYYLYCNGGKKSRMATNLLDAYGFNVTQVLLK